MLTGTQNLGYWVFWCVVHPLAVIPQFCGLTIILLFWDMGAEKLCVCGGPCACGTNKKSIFQIYFELQRLYKEQYNVFLAKMTMT